MSMITSCLHRVSLKKQGNLKALLESFKLSTMGSFGPEGGSKCERCHQLPSVYHSDAFGLMCNRCMQDDNNMQWALYLNRKYRTHLYISNSIIMNNIAGFILGTGLHYYCRCGDCDPNWFLHGWVCYPD